MRSMIMAIGVSLILGAGLIQPVFADEMGQYFMTPQAYSTYADMDAIVKAEYGPTAQVADWTDLAASFTGQIAGFCDSVGMPAYQSNAWVIWNGQGFFSSSRHYFVERHNGSVPGGWLVHADIDSHTLDLGSWDLTLPILVRLDTTIPADAFSWGRIKALYR